MQVGHCQYILYNMEEVTGNCNLHKAFQTLLEWTKVHCKNRPKLLEIADEFHKPRWADCSLDICPKLL